MKEILDEFKNLPRFSDGRINYSNSKKAAVMMCFVKFKDEILILKRSNKVSAYQGKWNGVGGFIDDEQPIEDKVLEELREEVGIKKELIKEMIVREPYKLSDISIDRIWIIFPVLVELKEKPEVRLDWEHTEYKWIRKEEINKYDVVYNLDETLEKVLGN